MSGVAIVASLLRGAADLTSLVPAASIKGGRLAEDAGLPAILIRSVSIVERQPLRRSAKVRTTERVAVLIRTDNYRAQRAILKIVRHVCGGVVADQIDDATNISVLTAGAGPDVIGPGDSFERTQDLRVSFDADA